VSRGSPGSDTKHGLRDMLATTGVALLAFAVGVIVFNSVLMPRIVHRAGEVRVPDIENLTVEQAQAALEPTELVLSRAGERFDPSVERGRIVSQDPAPGTPVRGHRRVSATVSLGEEYSSVPELFGEARRGAEILLEHSGLRVGGITRAPSDAVAEGLIAATDPPAESVLPRGGEVALLVSTGTPDEVFVMPDLKGREIGRVRMQLEARGFQVLSPPAGPAVGPIVAQDPQPGARLTRDRSITLQAAGRLVR
jgi:beta-lactam-binding protein with PASTA domain